MLLRSRPVSSSPRPAAFAAPDRAPLGDGYDVAVIGGGAFACAVARACALDGAGVVLLAPGAVGATPAERAWPVVRASDPDPRRVAIQADAPRRLARLARTLSPSPHADRCGALALASGPEEVDGFSRLAARAKALGVDAWMVPPREVAALAPPLAGGQDPAPGLFEPAALVVCADALALALARAAEEAGATIHPRTPVAALARDGAAVIGVETEGRFVRAGAVVLADDATAIRLIREGRGRLSLTREERTALHAPSGAPSIGPAVSADGVLVARDLTGALVLSGPLDGDALAARAVALAPSLAALETAAEEPVTVWTGVDRRAQIGPAEIDGLWLALGFGRDALSPALATADFLAAALAGRPADTAFEAFAPTRRPRVPEVVR